MRSISSSLTSSSRAVIWPPEMADCSIVSRKISIRSSMLPACATARSHCACVFVRSSSPKMRLISAAMTFMDSANCRELSACWWISIAFLIPSNCRSSIFFTAAVFFSAPRMNRYCWLSPILRACCAFLMKSSENFSCWRIERSIARMPWRIFISRSTRRSSLLLNRPMIGFALCSSNGLMLHRRLDRDRLEVLGLHRRDLHDARHDRPADLGLGDRVGTRFGVDQPSDFLLRRTDHALDAVLSCPVVEKLDGECLCELQARGVEGRNGAEHDAREPQ